MVSDYLPKPYVVGFAAETENLVENAKDKLVRKSLDMIVANDVSKTSSLASSDKPDIGFNSEYNALHVIWHPGSDSDPEKSAPGTPDPVELREQYFDIASKSQLAKLLISLIANEYKTKQNAKNTT